MCPFLESFDAFFMQTFLPVLIIAHSFKELHQIHVVTCLDWFIEKSWSFDVEFPVDLLHTLPHFIGCYIDYRILFLQFVQIMQDWLDIKKFCFVENKIVLGHLWVFQFTQLVPRLSFHYLMTCKPIAGDDSLANISRKNEAESAFVIFLRSMRVKSLISCYSSLRAVST